MERNDRIISTLSNGVRIVAQRSEGDVSYIGMLVNAGSRDDSPEAFGTAHFVEHTIFKGTASLRSSEINNRMEQIGGELNAFTTKEDTMIYTNAPAGYERRAFALLASLASEATFPEKEINLERDVITEEIFSYRDNPADAVYDEFDELIYRGSGLAHNILGTEESVKTIGRDTLLSFIRTRYTARNIVLYCVSPSDPERNVRLAEKYFGGIPAGDPAPGRLLPPPAPLFDESRDLDNHQANTIIGCRIFGRNDPRRHALFLFNNYLGGPAMNSRLNSVLRESRGLVYTVDSNVALYSDAGTLMIYYGCDEQKNDRCARLIRKEIERLADKPLSSSKFEAVRRQYCGQLVVSGAMAENCAMQLAKSVMYFGEVHDIVYTLERMQEVSAEDVRDVARMVLDSGLSRLTLR